MAQCAVPALGGTLSRVSLRQEGDLRRSWWMLGRASTGREEEEKHTRRQDCLGVIAEPRALSLPAPWQTPFLRGDRQAAPATPPLDFWAASA